MYANCEIIPHIINCIYNFAMNRLINVQFLL